MKPRFQRQRGTIDLLPEYLDRWKYVEAIWRELTATYAYREIVTPMFEQTELFIRGAGETSDIVSKEMYTFEDRGGRSITLRPEGTAAVVRAYVENTMYSWPQPVKLFYLQPMFRYERPQAGRLRQHTQYGAEVVGSPGPFTDAEVIHLLLTFYRRLGLTGLTVQVNSVGDANCRPAFNTMLVSYLESVQEHLCDDCKTRMNRNPLRVLDCKNAGCQVYLQKAPKMIDNLCGPCQEHFDGLRSRLEQLQVAYEINPRLVRGLDYYTRTAFEVVSDKLGAQDAIAGGGRYDGLVEMIGGDPVPAIGFGAGMERLLYALEKHGITFPVKPKLDAFVIPVGSPLRAAAEELLWQLRDSGITAEIDHLGGDKLKSQIAKAFRLGARFAIIIGEDELARGELMLRNLETKEQVSIPVGKIVQAVRGSLG
jgi:histidyl-tRNA synthetase